MFLIQIYLPGEFKLNPLSQFDRCNDTCSKKFIVTGLDNNQCIGKDSIIVKAYPGFDLGITGNTFILSPFNGDNINQTLKINNLERYNYRSIKIYDIQNKLVYFNDNYNNEFAGRDMDGNKLLEGAYYFILVYGNTLENSATTTNYFSLLTATK